VANEANQDFVELVKKVQQFGKDMEPVAQTLLEKTQPFVHAVQTFLDSDQAKKLGKQFGDLSRGLEATSRMLRETTKDIGKTH